MKSMFTFILIFQSLLLSAHAELVRHEETSSFKNIQRQIRDEVSKNNWDRDEVILVFDIDNTLLTTNQPLGGDAWFGWQEYLLEDDQADKSQLVGENFTELLTVQGQLYALSRMSPTEAELPAIVKDLQQVGRSVLLTSRGYDFRNSTERELEQNGFVFDQSTQMIMASKGFAGKYLPYDLEHPQAVGLKESDMDLVKNKKARIVTYMDGLYMTAGQHKGVMLKTLLYRLKAHPKAIFFVDDHQKHTVNMANAYMGRPEAVYTFQYTGMAEKVREFERSDKRDVTNKWQTLKSAIEAVFN